ncbi:ABC transporter permease [Rhodoligotrophos defluvii]|uniref:ABC transporter permease n=1 Tax=Rhodoligotrophos defluvii TaxID=2561934 RepID=UPI0010CA03B8|nr:ABC transporter permease [Rhodoligotrophos defluvii]
MTDLQTAAEAGTVGIERDRPAQRPRRRDKVFGFGFVVPLLAFITLAFNLPLLLTAAWSLVDPVSGSLTIAHYVEFATSSIYWTVIARTARVAFIVSVLCAVIGYPLAYWMTLLSRRGQVIALAIIVTSFWVSILVRTYAWIVVLGNAGLVNRALQYLGVIDRPIEFLYGELGVIIGMVNVLLPFMLLPLYAAMRQVDPRLRAVAYTLGASQGEFFRRVFFPLSLPALSASFVLVFILSLGFYITPAILGGGRVPLIANMLDILINRFPRWNLASAMSVVLLVLTLVLYGVYQRLRSRRGAASGQG